ncbi:hypothetical protein EW145_g4472 [Phellinidium pouzarii]|uniref:Fungal-type protein kinase domain-containing protein n=1 Tax=Phellinidium pouzarii TaxID=167371 RepID=A0A4S4L3K1_9AGAM|nr:hypothetical protein EW145_g4472 [Phellinidium pouzarii]
MRQTARYAADKLSFNLSLSHVIFGMVKNGQLWMCYYDHAGIVCSSALDFVSDLYKFVLLIKALESLSECNRGVIDAFRSLDGNLAHHNIEVNGHDLCLSERLSGRPPYGLVGRATRVYAMKCHTLDLDFPDRKYALKMSWPLKRRESEAQIIEAAIDVLEKLDKNNEYYPRELRDCLPRVFQWQDFIDLEQEGGFRSKLGAFSDENRIFRVIAFEELVPIYELKPLDAFKQAFREIVQGHHFLYTCEEKIKHRDISVENLMYRVVEGGAIRGVLNDWDLAKVGDPARVLPKGTRTGTLPFMSADLLEALAPPLPGRPKEKPLPDHIERFDWESMFYVLFWIACHYDDGKDVNPMALNDWVYPDRAVLPAIKDKLIPIYEVQELDAYYKQAFREIDLAKVGSSLDYIAKGTWTGALPYILPSVSTPPPPVHLERFEWETLFYVLYWIACHYDKREYVKCDALHKWNNSNANALFGAKNIVLTRPNYRLVTAYFFPLAETWLE